MSDESRGERLQIMLTEDELKALDDWRFSQRMPSRAAAVRELLRRGLANILTEGRDGRTRSRDFSVVDRRDGEGRADGRDGRVDGHDGRDRHDGRLGDGSDGAGAN